MVKNNEIINKADEEHLQYSEMVSTIFEVNPDAIVITTLSDSEIIDCNQEYLNQIGYSREEVIGHTALKLKLISSDELQAYVNEIQKEKTASNYEIKVRRKDGSLIYVLYSARLITVNNEKMILNIGHDITKRKLAEDALHRSEEKYRSILENIQDAYFRSDTTGTVIMASPSAARMYRYDSPQEIIGISALSFYKNPEDRNYVLEEITKHGKIVNNEVESVRKDGTYFWASQNAQYYYDDKGQIQGTETFVRNITDSKYAEQENQRLLENEQQLTEELLSSNEELQKKDNDMAQLYSALSKSEKSVRLKLETILSPEGDIGKLDLVDILDVKAIQSLMDNYYKTFQLPMAMIDIKGEVLSGVGWQDICTQFHRVNPETKKHCIESDTELSMGVPQGDFKIYKCKNNMWDIATPIIVGGKHLGNIFSGQFFFDDEELDYELFRKQAIKYDFDEEKYISALEAAPKVSRQTVNDGMAFFTELAYLISSMSYTNLNLARSLKERDKLLENEQQLTEELQTSNEELQAVTEELQDSNEELLNQGDGLIHVNQALLKSEKRMNRSQEIAHLGSWELDIDKNCLSWSDEVYRIFGLQPQEFDATYEAFLDNVHPDDRAAVNEAYLGSIRDGQDTYEIEHRVMRKSTHEVRVVYEKCEHFRDNSGRIFLSVGMVHDITERKQAEKAIRESLIEVERSNTELEQFAYITSHDLREPLRMITSFLQLLERRYKDQLDEDANDYIGFAVDGAKRLDAMINDILIYSRVANKERTLTNINLNETLEEVYFNLKTSIEEANAEITHDQLPTLVLDGQLMIQLFQNLIGNAIKYRSEKRPKVYISVIKEDKNWLFCVKDNGIGISQDHLERIFTIFQRLHSKEEYEGTGIGLAIVQKIVHQHGGQIWAESELGKGSTFYFTIPNEIIYIDYFKYF